MTAGSLTAFALASIGLAFAPGPDILTVITRSVAQGTRAGLVATLGFASGVTVHTTAAALGLSLLLRKYPGAQLGVQIAGALYLVYLAVRMLASRDALVLEGGSATPARPLARIYGQSFLMNVLNPKVTLFFLALLPQFADKGSAPTPSRPVQFIILGVIFATCTILCFGSCALAAGTLSRWLRRHAGAARPLRIATACVFLAIAARLAFT